MVKSSRVVITGLSETTLISLRQIYNNLPDDESNNTVKAIKSLEALTGYYTGTKFEEPQGFRDELIAKKELGYIPGSLLKLNQEYKLNNTILGDAANIISSADRQRVGNELITRCKELGIAPAIVI